MLKNPNFEGGLQNWNYGGIHQVDGKVSSVNVKTGAKYFGMYQDSPAPVVTRQLTIKQTGFATPVGSNYQVKIWANRVSGNCAFTGNLQDQVVISRSGVIATGWAEVTAYVTAEKAVSNFVIRFTCSSVGI